MNLKGTVMIEIPMKRTSLNWLSAVVVGFCLSNVSVGQDLSSIEEVMNYRQYSDTFASAGQPKREQFEMIKENGFERVIYIAFNTGNNAISDEDQIVKGLGMDYLHIPVDFANPTVRDFNAFADAMRREPDAKTLLHCQVNARATAFSFLYRVIYDGVSVEEAKRDMNTVWQPNEVWRDFIFAVLGSYGKSVDECESCDWTPPQR
jgi:protein tyrosine phosphatase (PTP) superfamily phosphohydrolase (DUF442 family)